MLPESKPDTGFDGAVSSSEVMNGDSGVLWLGFQSPRIPVPTPPTPLPPVQFGLARVVTKSSRFLACCAREMTGDQIELR